MTASAEVAGKPRVSLWNNPQVRALLVQAILVVVFVILAYEIVHNTLENLHSRNISSGFEFLSKSSGFDIIQSLIPYNSSSSYGRALVVGFLNTILISVVSIIAATIIGFVMGIMRLSKNRLVALVGTFYVELFRNIPLLLWIFIFYAAVLKPLPGPRQALNVFDSFFLSNRGFMTPRPIFGEGAWLGLAGLILAIAISWYVARLSKARQAALGERYPVLWITVGLVIILPLLGLLFAGFPVQWDFPVLQGFNFAGGVTLIPEFMALFLALSIYHGTYIAESVRAGIMAVSHGQSEAALALGLRPGKVLRLVVVPQAMRVIIPPLASTYLSLTKNSSLAVAIGYPDLVAAGGTVLNQTGQAVEIVGIWMVVYLSLSLLTSGFMNWFNSRMRLVER